jgi:hypothetical protein
VLSLAKSSSKTSAVMFCLILLGLTLAVNVPMSLAVTGAMVRIDPEFIKLGLGGNFTITVTASNVNGLSSWQVALKYNATVAYCSAIWIPEESIFADQSTYFHVVPLVNENTVDGFNYLLTGVVSLVGSVDVSSAILLEANFTVLDPGQTNLVIATFENPVVFSQAAADKQYTTLLDPDLSPITFATAGSTVIGGEINAAPIAYFSIVSSEVDNVTKLVINGNVPVDVQHYVQGYVDVMMTFNASQSFDPDGSRIVSYDWDFGNGYKSNISSAAITYSYPKTGVYTASLTVWDDGDPSLPSASFSQVVVIGLTLSYLDWSPFIYSVFALLVVTLIILEFRTYMLRKKPLIRL